MGRGRWKGDKVESQHHNHLAPRFTSSGGTLVRRRRKMAQQQDALDDTLCGQTCLGA